MVVPFGCSLHEAKIGRSAKKTPHTHQIASLVRMAEIQPFVDSLGSISGLPPILRVGP
jgi:hypothetical protein